MHSASKTQLSRSTLNIPSLAVCLSPIYWANSCRYIRLIHYRSAKSNPALANFNRWSSACWIWKQDYHCYQTSVSYWTEVGRPGLWRHAPGFCENPADTELNVKSMANNRSLLAYNSSLLPIIGAWKYEVPRLTWIFHLRHSLSLCKIRNQSN